MFIIPNFSKEDTEVVREIIKESYREPQLHSSSSRLRRMEFALKGKKKLTYGLKEHFFTILVFEHVILRF